MYFYKNSAPKQDLNKLTNIYLEILIQLARS
jgi:hypothetical protein